MSAQNAASKHGATTTNGRGGRRKGQIGPTACAIRESVLDDLIDRYDRMTVRQVYYALEVQGIVEKTEGGYRQVQQQVLTMRREGLLDWDFITDGTRWQRKPESWESAGDYFESMVRHYRRDLWRGQGVRIEVWLEKDALADVVVDITAAWDVALMVSRGQSSSTFLYTAAKAAQAAYLSDGTETIIYALYDYDAGGQRASHTIEREIPKYAPGVPITFERLAVTQEQISAWNLPTRPAKKSDPQAAQFGAVAVELDAIPPDRLRALVEDSIITHVDTGAWAIEQAIEAEESAGLLALCDTFNAGLEDDR